MINEGDRLIIDLFEKPITFLLRARNRLLPFSMDVLSRFFGYQ